MADLTYIQATLETKIVGQDSAGNNANYVSADANGNMLVKDYSDGPVTPGTVAAASALIGGQFNTALPTLTNGQQAAVQVDASGRILIGILEEDHNYGAVGANTIRAAAQIGNATGAADFNFGTIGAQSLRTAAQIGNATGAADFNAGATGAQTLRVSANQGTTPWTIQGNSASGATKAGNPVQIGGVFNTTQPTVTTGQTVEAQSTARGALIVSTGSDQFNTGIARLTTPADYTANSLQSLTLDQKGKVATIDEYAIYSKWGQGFGVTTNEVTISGTTETALFYAKNANASGKTLRIKRFVFTVGSSGSGSIFRIYFNPTSSANGSALTAAGNRQTGQATVVSTFFKSPTVSANGTIYAEYKVSTNSTIIVEQKLALFLDQNNNLLVTTQVSNGNNPASVSMEFIEE